MMLRTLAFAALARKKVVVKSIVADPSSKSDPAFETKCEVKMQNIARGPILRLVMHPGSTYLLV